MAAPPWRIYYADGVVEGVTEADWRAAPAEAVQVVVSFAPPEDGAPRWFSRSRPIIADRTLWTGDDDYDPFGWGAKGGTLIADEAYREIWERACGDPSP